MEKHRTKYLMVGKRFSAQDLATLAQRLEESNLRISKRDVPFARKDLFGGDVSCVFFGTASLYNYVRFYPPGGNDPNKRPYEIVPIKYTGDRDYMEIAVGRILDLKDDNFPEPIEVDHLALEIARTELDRDHILDTSIISGEFYSESVEKDNSKGSS